MNVLGKFSIFATILAFVSVDASMEGFDLTTLKVAPAATAEARVGEPLTPLSYSGVARRTTRRVVRRTTIRVNALPAGCVYGRYYGAYYYRCGSAYYERSSGAYIKVVVD